MFRALTGLLLAIPLIAAAPVPRGVDPLTAKIDVRDADRFAALWRVTAGQPTAAQIEGRYLRSAGEGMKVFTPNRIIDAANLEKQIAAHHDWYEEAVTRCLPWVAENNGQLRSIYLGLRGLLPEKPLPRIYVVVGGANSGGTAAPGVQVLGLEVLCNNASTRQDFAALLRTFFAHETAHAFQRDLDALPTVSEPLLTMILQEGGADYVAELVTGATPSDKRDAYGRAHSREIWSEFLKDRPVANSSYTQKDGFTGAGKQAFAHWLYNGGSGKLPGWETDMGYWLGMQIAKAYVERAPDPHAALREVLALENPAEILRKSHYADKFTR